MPDPGFVFVDVDLEQADVQVVAWEAGSDRLKEVFRDPDKDLHDENTAVIYGIRRGEVSDSEFKKKRGNTKAGVHGTNYRGSAFAVAKSLGITLKEAKEFQRIWFGANPEILEWHQRTEAMIIEKGYLENKFGFRMPFIKRIDKHLLNEAQAWVPQSTVGTVINKGWENIARDIDGRICQVMMQVHDSLLIQIRKDLITEILPQIKQAMTIPIPYEDELIIGLGHPEIGFGSYGNKVAYTWEGQELAA